MRKKKNLTCASAVSFLTRVLRRLWSSSSGEWICCRSRLGWTTSSAGGSLPSRPSRSPRPAEATGRFSAQAARVKDTLHTALNARLQVLFLHDATADGEPLAMRQQQQHGLWYYAGYADAITWQKTYESTLVVFYRWPKKKKKASERLTCHGAPCARCSEQQASHSVHDAHIVPGISSVQRR